MRSLNWSMAAIGALVGGLLGNAIGLVPTLLVGGLLSTASALWLIISPVGDLREALEAGS